MILIKLVDARRGLSEKCNELFSDSKIAEAVYRYLCDGIEECEAAEPQRKKGKWVFSPDHAEGICTSCNYKIYGRPYQNTYLIVPYNFCPNCGAEMTEGEEDEEKRIAQVG